MGYGSSTLGVLAQVRIRLSTTPSTLEVLSQTCMYHGGIIAGITVDEGIGLLALIQCMHMQIVVVTVSTISYDLINHTNQRKLHKSYKNK